jgi:hypothetical protein
MLTAWTMSCAMSTKPSDRPESAPSLADPIAPATLRRVAALTALLVGWIFIAWHNHFYFTPAVVVLALGWGASIATLHLLWRVGAAGADSTIDHEDWWLAVGQSEELEREKRALLKSIREIEFDHQTGKLSDRDADEMIQVFRNRAIDVMKALDAVADRGGPRAEIEREVRARVEIESARKAGKKARSKGQGPHVSASIAKVQDAATEVAVATATTANHVGEDRAAGLAAMAATSDPEVAPAGTKNSEVTA